MYIASREEIIKLINSNLNGPWTEQEVAVGKDMTVMQSWRHSIRGILGEYREMGWCVDRKMQISSNAARRDFIRFSNPLWESDPTRARGYIVQAPLP